MATRLPRRGRGLNAPPTELLVTSAQDGVIAALQLGNPVFQFQADTLEQFQIFLFAMRFAGIDQSVDPPVAAEQSFKIIVHAHSFRGLRCWRSYLPHW